MTAAEFKSWLDQHFPGHDRRGRRDTSVMAEAARYFGITKRSVARKRNGELRVTRRDELLMERKIRRSAGRRTDQTGERRSP